MSAARRRSLFCFSLSGIGVLLCLAVRASSGAADSSASVTVAPGWDWSLPAGIQPVPYSGFITWGKGRFDKSVTVSGIRLRWKALNPGPGQYDWKPLLDAIDKNRAAGMRTGIQFMAVERPGVPEWVIKQFNPPIVDVPPMGGTGKQPWRVQTVPPWIPGVDKAYHEFLAAFGKTGIAQRDDVVYGYINAISPSRGEELNLRAQDAAIYEKVSGLTPQVFGDWLRRRVDAMLVAFKGVEYKLAWMSRDEAVGPTPAYQEATKGIWKYAIDHGAGIRAGGVDFQHFGFVAPVWGNSVDPDGYALVDDLHPTIVQGRYRGDENEEYGKSWEWRFGPVEGHKYRNRICWLRCLQTRLNFVLVAPETLALNPEMNEFVLMTLGRTAANSPDAWAYLRECQVFVNKKPQPVKNTERWLVQRDVEGSRSVATERIDRERLVTETKNHNYDFDARRTDRANGQDGLAFRLDEKFWPKPGPALIKATFTDRAATRWRIVTSDGNGKIVKSATVENTGDGQLKTATFRVDDLAAARAFPGQMDFRLAVEGPGDLTCTMVRVVKADWKGRDLMSDTWVATDALGRALPTSEETGPPRPGKFVGIFYFTWLGAHGYDESINPPKTLEAGQGVLPKEPGRVYKSPFDVTRILAGEQEWGAGYFAPHHWAEPELGYYLSNDEYVIRRHAQLLAEAGVDALIVDCTNGYTYRDTYLTICKVLRQMQEAGVRVPQLAFIANSDAPDTVRKLFNEFYAKDLYTELWFRWNGKPLLLSPPDGLSPQFRDFFTIRHSWAWSKPDGWFQDGRDKWTWLDRYPQKPGWHESPDKPEEISVTVAEHPIGDINVGRSYHDGKQPPLDKHDLTPDTPKGLYFAEQWKRALEVDPEFIFITGWNEWVAGRLVTLKGPGLSMCGRPTQTGESAFFDEYNEEYSRDIEPMKGHHADNYYYQMAANIRRFKGARPVPTASAPKTIKIDGDFADWADVSPECRDAVGDTKRRNHPGWGRIQAYIDATGRNDILTCKAARDDKYVYFYTETAGPLTSFRDPHWMLLFIDADSNAATGWEGYDYLLNEPVIDGSHTTLKRAIKGADGAWQWELAGTVGYQAKENNLEIAVPRKLLGLPAGSALRFDFHWADNIQKMGDIVEFAVHGDSAPDRRFNYRFATRR